ncbi:Per1-like-domain-containing protein [Radiomyces spectabilis]|uniref:Per1-like-domain-containing protein n=1 Tax=Radiomyces spectabilis TaxID=64574 RepID=UPI002220DF9F|nr:Per1-like-domain-containing protein [Radiomyces spectabilis]KAI8390898.1 Per1-like-domain-containing protein [Radiomyces spectabilis]
MLMKDTRRTVKVAVVGSGLAGLTTAYLLSTGTTVALDAKDEPTKFEVHLFERNEALGMDAASISVGGENEFRIDHLQIPIKAAKFSFGWYRIESSKEPMTMSAHEVASHSHHQSYLTYSGARAVGHISSPICMDASWTTFFANVLLWFWRLLIVAFSYTKLMTMALWSHYRGHLYDSDHPVASLTLQEWLEQHHIHPFFVHEIFVPLFAAVCTNSWQSMMEYPATYILEYMARGLFQESYVVDCGVKQVVAALSRPLKHVHLGTQITCITPNETPGQGRLVLHEQNGNRSDFDHIVFATQGNQALKILSNCQKYLSSPTPRDDGYDQWKKQHQLVQDLSVQIDMLQRFKYDPSLVINHTDTRLLPHDQSQWKVLNFATLDASIQPHPSDMIVPYPHNTTMTTHILNATHRTIADNETLYLQTTNPCIAPDPASVLSVSWFERATVTVKSKQTIEKCLFEPLKGSDGKVKLGNCQGKGGIWFVGSYCWRGIPLLEGCVASAETVVANGIAVQENCTIKLGAVLLLLAGVFASTGDRLPEYRQCVQTFLDLPLRLLKWSIPDDCRYQCMQTLTTRAKLQGDRIHQFHGKWPFLRLYGMQEPASVLFSILNGLFHARYYSKMKHQLSPQFDLKRHYLGMSVIAMNAWIWSTVFHMRDNSITEKLDYFSAGLYIMYGLYLGVLRIFYVRGWPALAWSILCAALFMVHVAYLTLKPRFDYGYNMTACITIGSLQTSLWLGWSILQYTSWGQVWRRPFAWLAGLSVVLVSCAMALEVFDFPPWYDVVDAHALWHAATIPLIPLFYQFLLRDAQAEMNHPHPSNLSKKYT